MSCFATLCRGCAGFVHGFVQSFDFCKSLKYNKKWGSVHGVHAIARMYMCVRVCVRARVRVHTRMHKPCTPCTQYFFF